jgi:hypothetical protein
MMCNCLRKVQCWGFINKVTEIIAVKIPYGNPALLWNNMVDDHNYVKIFSASLPH